MDNRPIGILDSGIGGMTIAAAVNRLLPHERIVFFGDTAHHPYGDKTRHAIAHFCERIVEFLLSHNCKLILIACNSASAAAYGHLMKKFGHQIPILNVIDPIVDWVIEQDRFRNIGVLGTKATVTSRVYAQKFARLAPDLKVIQKATPLLAPMIEEGFFNNNISRTVINSYLSDTKLQNIDGLILACTHYPLIKAEIMEYYSGKVEVIDSTDVIAQEVSNRLEVSSSFADADVAIPDQHFYVSDFTTSFQKATQIFFGRSLKLEEKLIWE